MTYTVELYCNGNVTDDIVRKINNKVADLYWKKSWLGIREWQMCNYDKTTSALTFTTLSFATITELADLLQSCIIDVLYSNRCILSGKICGMTESGDIHMVSIVDNIIRVYDKKTLIEIVDEIEAEL